MTSERDPYHPLPALLWTPPHVCPHPRQKLAFTGHFPPDAPSQSVFDAHCIQCGTHWNQTSTDAPWEELMLRFARGEFGVVSATELEIPTHVEWKRQTRYDRIMRDVTGSDNPIRDSVVQLKPFD